MKRFLSLFLAFLMCVGLCAAAFAANETPIPGADFVSMTVDGVAYTPVDGDFVRLDSPGPPQPTQQFLDKFSSDPHTIVFAMTNGESGTRQINNGNQPGGEQQGNQQSGQQGGSQSNPSGPPSITYTLKDKPDILILDVAIPTGETLASVKINDGPDTL